MAKLRIIYFLALGVMICAGALGQESTSTSQVTVPVTVPEGVATSDVTPLVSSSTMNSDNRPPSGAQPVGLGLSGNKALHISLNGNESGQSSVTGRPQTSWESISSFGGALNLNFGTSKSSTLLSYNGNAVVYSDRSPNWTTYQDLSFSQSVRVGRWTIMGADILNVTPNAAGGWYGYGSSPASALTSTSAVNPQYIPNQSILTPTTTSLFNTVLGQLEYGISRRSSWTATGSYGLLRFLDSGSGFNDSNQIVAATGYNRSFTARDTLSVTYSYTEFRYTNFGSTFDTQNVQLGYSHLVAGRWSFQASGGPEFRRSRFIGSTQNELGFAGRTNLLYQRGLTGFSVGFFEGTTAGSGVLAGARTQSVQSGLTRDFGRQWHTGVGVGYARNTGFTTQQSLSQQTYNMIFVTPSVRRVLTRNLGMTLNYSYQRQISSASCGGVACGTTSWSIVGLGFDYNFRPIKLE